MKWITNYKIGSRIFSFDEEREYLSDKVIGRPQATKYYSVEKLEEWGLIGVYVEDIIPLPSTVGVIACAA